MADSEDAVPPPLTEKHNLAETEFLVDVDGDLTAFAHHELSGQLNYRT
mgnify:CR=1 FL=1